MVTGCAGQPVAGECCTGRPMGMFAGTFTSSTASWSFVFRPAYLGVRYIYWPYQPVRPAARRKSLSAAIPIYTYTVRGFPRDSPPAEAYYTLWQVWTFAALSFSHGYRYELCWPFFRGTSPWCRRISASYEVWQQLYAPFKLHNITYTYEYRSSEYTCNDKRPLSLSP